MFNKKESRVYSSKKGSEVYVHSGLHDPWGALESDGLDDPDDVRDIVEAIEEFNGPDGTGPKAQMGLDQRIQLSKRDLRRSSLGQY